MTMDFVKEDTILGTKKVVIGDKFHDLVLENLGKIYIRYGNSYKEFNALMSALSKGVASGGSKVIIEENGISDDLSIYPNGSLVYDARSGILYLIFNGEAFILAEHVNTNSSRYVLKTGDTMTGQLVINTKEAPLKVKSTELVKNLNANYLQGYDASAFARRNYDETINGSWTFTGKNKFTNKNTFEDTAIFTGHDKNAAIRVGTGDIITDGSMGSSVFVSGMNGCGWRLDSETNTLELDNLIVRGILNVYELVVNKVSATNGSLWITDSFKVKTVHTLEKIEYTAGLAFSNIDFSLDKYYLFYQNVTQSSTYTSLEQANDLLDLYNHAKITVPGEALSTRIHKGTNSVTVDVYKYVFQIISIDKLKTFVHDGSVITPLDLCKANVLEELQIAGIIDFTCIYLYNMQDIPDKMLSADDVFNTKFDLNHFRIVTNPIFEDGKYYFYDSSADVAVVNLYYKYFGGGELYILESENDEYPVFKPGDVLRCLKFTGKSVKQYHGIVCGLIGAYGFIMQLQNHSILNRKTEVAYDGEGNLLHFDSSMDDALYNRSDTLIKGVSDLTYSETDGSKESGLDKIGEDYQDGIRNLNSSQASQEKAEAVEEYAQSDEFKALCTPQEGDGIVRVGSIVWGVRRNSMYLTSSENYSPFQDIMVGVNRPDYGVVYFTPKVRKCTVQVMIDEETGIYKEQEVYLQNQEFCSIMDKGFDYENLDPEADNYATKLAEYETWLGTNEGLIFKRYKDDVQRIDVPASQSDKGDLDFYGLTNVKDVYLTYAENDYEPKYHNKNGDRIRVKAKVTNLESTFYTAPKVEGLPIKVIEPDKHVNSYEEAVYQSVGSLSKILAIGWRI